MEAARLVHVDVLAGMLESLFPEYNVPSGFSLSGSSAVKKNGVEKECINFSWFMVGKADLLNKSNYPQEIKGYLEKAYKKTIGYLNVDWSCSSEKKVPMSISISFKFA
jgi:hypothetical protein